MSMDIIYRPERKEIPDNTHTYFNEWRLNPGENLNIDEEFKNWILENMNGILKPLFEATVLQIITDDLEREQWPNIPRPLGILLEDVVLEPTPEPVEEPPVEPTPEPPPEPKPSRRKKVSE